MGFDKEKMYNFTIKMISSFLPGWTEPGVELASDRIKDKLNLHQNQTIYDKIIKVFENTLNNYPTDQTYIFDWILECANKNTSIDFKATFNDVINEKNISTYLKKLQDSSMDMENKLSVSEIQCIASKTMINMKNEIASDSELFTCWQLVINDNKLDSIQYDLQEIKNKLESSSIPKVHTEFYQKDFYKTLCLHRGRKSAHITLDDVFVMPNVKLADDSIIDAERCVQKFINSEDQILLLLAHGGYGKSSFVSYMATHQSKISTYRKIYIIRLREFASDENGNFSIDTLYKRICQEIKHTNKIEQNAILIFDGLDELSAITRNDENNIKDKSNEILIELCKFLKDNMNRKIIITSRPAYIFGDYLQEYIDKLNKDGTAFGNDTPIIQIAEYYLYNQEQRRQFVTKLMQADLSITMNDFGCKHIYELKDGRSEDDIIYNSPFIMYLICSAKNAKNISVVTKEGTENRWLLFRQVFHDIYPAAAYDPKHKSLEEEQKNLSYKIICEMAYRMYKSGYKKNVISREEMREIIQGVLLTNSNEINQGLNQDILINLLQENAALYCYINKKESGALEFAHNHIRDFFLCEYILHGLNHLYQDSCNTSGKGTEIANWLSEHFKYYNLHKVYFGLNILNEDNVTLKFFELAIIYLNGNYDNLKNNVNNENLHFIFDTYCQNGGLNSYNYSSDKVSVNFAANNVLNNSIGIFKTLITNKDSDLKIQWFDIDIFNKGDHSIIETVKTHLKNADLRGADLSKAYLSGAYLSEANLSEVDLSIADLSGASLRGADLSEADLSEANLSRANLSEANLYRANLSNTN